MFIYWLGQSAFKIQEKEVTLAIDPHNVSGLKMPKFQADILLITHDHPDHNYTEAIKGDPFIINGAGEYEIKDVFVYGLRGSHDTKESKQTGALTHYLIEWAGIKIAHLGGLKQETLTEKQIEKLDGCDILLIPVGGDTTLNSAGAVKIISQIQPRLVIPMHYKIPGANGKLDSVDKFLNEFGATNAEKMDKLKISNKDLPQEETKVILLNKA